jgi:hypothetical protein
MKRITKTIVISALDICFNVESWITSDYNQNDYIVTVSRAVCCQLTVYAVMSQIRLLLSDKYKFKYRTCV